MGIDYSLCTIIAREQASSVLRHLSSIITPESYARLEGLKWEPLLETKRKTLGGTTETDAIGIYGLERIELDRENSYCFALQVQLEAEMASHLDATDFDCFDSPGSFGCMWTSFYAGERYLLVEMTAATSRMSRVVRESAEIHELWRGFARSSNSIVAYVDVEEACGISLYPRTDGDIFLPDVDTLTYIDDYRFSVDPFVELVLAANGG